MIPGVCFLPIYFTNRSAKELNLSGSWQWQQCHFASYNTPSHMVVATRPLYQLQGYTRNTEETNETNISTIFDSRNQKRRINSFCSPILTVQMLAKPESGDQHANLGAQDVYQSNIFPQPWWHGPGTNASYGGTASRATTERHLNVSGRDQAVHSQTSTALADGGGNRGQEKQHPKHVPLTSAETMGEHSERNSQMELIGHSIVLTPYPFPDPQFSGVFASYGPQAMVPPHMYGLHHARMPLPLEMEEAPVYVNAKQYHGILRRRQCRAKAELEKKVMKSRKPYLHESRHQHAMKRARGCGGRFLNTKKLDNGGNPTSERSLSSNLSSQFGSECGETRNPNSATHQREVNFSMVQNKVENFCNGNRNGDFVNQHRISMHGGNGVPPR